MTIMSDDVPNIIIEIEHHNAELGYWLFISTPPEPTNKTAAHLLSALVMTAEYVVLTGL